MHIRRLEATVVIELSNHARIISATKRSDHGVSPADRLDEGSQGSRGESAVCEAVRVHLGARQSFSERSDVRNQIGDEAMISLLDVLKDVPLTSFDISNANCGVSTATKLAELLSTVANSQHVKR